RGYLLRAARNRALNAVRADRARDRHEDAAGVELPAAGRAASPAGAAAGGRVEGDAAERRLEAVDGRRRAARIWQAVEALPARCREAMVLRWRHHLSHREIAEAMGISVKGVERQLTRGLAALRAELADLEG
ncbi:MAG: sigma-70 family RNA polymerase sigma factor, partial [Gemmatimonadetes bacterium]